METVSGEMILKFANGVWLEERLDASGAPQRRLHDASGPGSWGDPLTPLYLSRHKADNRYLLLPFGAPPSITPESLLVLGEVLECMSEDDGHNSYAEDWKYHFVLRFPRDLSWEFVDHSIGHTCHRIASPGASSDWSYMHEAATLWDTANSGWIGLPDACAGQCKSRRLMRIVRIIDGVPPPPIPELNGWIYLKSEDKVKKFGYTTSYAKTMAQGTRIEGIQIIEGSSGSAARFPDPGSDLANLIAWSGFLAERSDWPFENLIFRADSNKWAKIKDPNDLASCATAEGNIPMHILDPGRPPEVLVHWEG
jgi:hypothetical protein